jgi:hypothetical protein
MDGSATVLTGTRDKQSNLWSVPLNYTPPLNVGLKHSAHNVYDQKSIQDTTTYLHACCFIPVKYTWLKSIQNDHFATWTSVTVENVCTYLGKSDATAKGHLNQIRQNIRSTQQAEVITEPDTDIVQEKKSHYLYATTLETNKIYSDLTGRFQQHR